MLTPSIPSTMRDLATTRSGQTAITFIDYSKDKSGTPEALTWADLYRRTLDVARELRRHSHVGDRAVILAPQGLDYVTAFLGAVQAGLIAVPLLLPKNEGSEERAGWVMKDASPAVVLTTSSAVDKVRQYVAPQPGTRGPSIVEVDLINSYSSVRDGAAQGDWPEAAYLQYTSGSTRPPAGVVISHRNFLATVDQLMASYFPSSGGVTPQEATAVTWLPLFHDMGLAMGVATMFFGGNTVLTSPRAFMEHPARWIHLLANHPHTYSAAPDVSLDYAMRRVRDADIEGIDLGTVHTILNGGQRVLAPTVQRFAERFARFNLRNNVVRPSYGLAEATVYVASSRPLAVPEFVVFDASGLSVGRALRRPQDGRPVERGTRLASYEMPDLAEVRVVDPDTRIECPTGLVGEIWVRGDNVGAEYWGKPQQSQTKFEGRIAEAAPGVCEGPWLRTGDSGFVDGGELFIIGREKDMLMIDGRRYSPDDIESTINEILLGRCVAVMVPDLDDDVEKLVVVVEIDYQTVDLTRFDVHAEQVVSAIADAHGLEVSDVVLASPGALPTTTSGKVRRGQCAHLYREGRIERVGGASLS